MEIHLTLKNIQTRNGECPDYDNVGRMLVITQKATGQMGAGDCRPYCDGVQLCVVTNITKDEVNRAERHTLQCRCHGDGACGDVALWLPRGAATDPGIPMEICNVEFLVLTPI